LIAPGGRAPASTLALPFHPIGSLHSSSAADLEDFSLWPFGLMARESASLGISPRIKLAFCAAISRWLPGGIPLAQEPQSECRWRVNRKGGEKLMKPIGSLVFVLVLAAGLANAAGAADDTIKKEQAGDHYCHMKFPAITQSSLFTSHPVPKGQATADVVDYYGACNESATSKDQIVTQRMEALHDWKE
jgi:hypothetical protein